MRNIIELTQEEKNTLSKTLANRRGYLLRAIRAYEKPEPAESEEVKQFIKKELEELKKEYQTNLQITNKL